MTVMHGTNKFLLHENKFLFINSYTALCALCMKPTLYIKTGNSYPEPVMYISSLTITSKHRQLL